ncbi:MAG: hypothetical protein BWY63_02302 [Chloroflexi bacterium ADurb.Bin360]|nr:MAG: hypothetical protein BWY63_02302 [Chloroflexi bacterium ADurb.Bin360]
MRHVGRADKRVQAGELGRRNQRLLEGALSLKVIKLPRGGAECRSGSVERDEITADNLSERALPAL